MNTALSSDVMIKKFKRTIDHCSWLIESIKPVCFFLIDEQDSILTYYNFEIENLPEIGLNAAWTPMKKQLVSVSVKEWFLENKRVGIAFSNGVEENTVQNISDYINRTYHLAHLDQAEDKLKRLNLKDILVHLLYQSNYTRQLDKVSKALIDYLGSFFNETAALYFINSTTNRFLFNMVSNDQFQGAWRYLSFTPEVVEKLVDGQFMSEVEIHISNNSDENKALLFPLRNNGEIFALLFLTVSKSHLDKATIARLKSILYECSKLVYEIQSYIYSGKMSRRYQQLFTVTKKFHSTMDDREVLEDVLKTIANHYHHCEVNLLFTDESIEENHNQDPYAVQAFLSGTVQMNQTDSYFYLYAPLAGRQGVYGVIEIKSNDIEAAFPQEDVEFIHLLANTAGHAFENARLYQQSQRSISDLRLINKTSQQLNANLRFHDTVDYLLKEIHDNFETEELGFFTIKQDLSYTVYPKSTPFFHTAEGTVMINRVIARINENNEGMFRGDMQSEDWGNMTFRSLVALPMILNDNFLGLIVAVHREPYHFSFDEFRLLQSIVRHSTLAISNARLREELEFQVNTDQLTGLFAREYLNKKVEHSLKVDQNGVMILIDIDNFKIINDTHGHAIGDEILITVAKVIKQNIRKSDIAARWGGEELAVYLPNCEVTKGVAIAERIVDSVQQSTEPRVTISCGLSYWKALEFNGGGRELFVCADKALYRAKEEGKNRLYICE